tara:strand:+ start:33886 stop:34620 length:735 start_codon:yes stop_codon:yes gene_type:complete
MSYDFVTDAHRPAIGLIVLQADETIEQDMRRIFDWDTLIYVTRVPSALEVSRDTLQEMANTLPAAARLFPAGAQFAAVGYGCTSGTAQIGAEKIIALITQELDTAHVTEPLSALIAACGTLGVTRLGLLSPYVASVSGKLVEALAASAISCPVFGSFDEAEESVVSHISPASTYAAAVDLATKGDIDALFLSCTNLRTLDIIAKLEVETGLPVLSSNQVLGWDLARRAGITLPHNDFGQLFRKD